MKRKGRLCVREASSQRRARHRGCPQHVLVTRRNGRGGERPTLTPRFQLGIQTNVFTTLRHCAAGQGTPSDGDDEFSFRQGGSYRTQALTGDIQGCKATQRSSSEAGRWASRSQKTSSREVDGPIQQASQKSKGLRTETTASVKLSEGTKLTERRRCAEPSEVPG